MTYSLDFRKKGVSIRRREKLSFGQTPKRFGVSVNSLFLWSRQIEAKETKNRAPIKIDKETLITDQGVEFTSLCFTKRLEKEGLKISMDGKGRALDNVFIEDLWRRVKYEDIYPKGYESLKELKKGIDTAVTRVWDIRRRQRFIMEEALRPKEGIRTQFNIREN